MAIAESEQAATPRSGRRPLDLRVRPFPVPSPEEWREPEAVLRRMYDAAEGYAIEAAEWYLHDRVRKKTFSRLLRGLAVVFGAAGGLQPLITVAMSGKSSGWGYVCLALAGACVAVDHFLGLSSRWLRDMVTAQRIQRRLQRFQIDWTALNAQAAAAQPEEPVDVPAYLDLLRGFVLDVSDITINETSEWVSEFQAGIAQLQGQSSAGGR
jgi:hypothetical protein